MPGAGIAGAKSTVRGDEAEDAMSETETGSMVVDMEPESQKGLTLESVLDLKAARGLHDKLLALRGSALVVDASTVERIGAQCLQILLSAKQSWSRDRLDLVVSGQSEGFVNSLRQMGFGPDLAPIGEGRP